MENQRTLRSHDTDWRLKSRRHGPFGIRYTLLMPESGALYFRRYRNYRIAYEALYGYPPDVVLGKGYARRRK